MEVVMQFVKLLLNYVTHGKGLVDGEMSGSARTVQANLDGEPGWNCPQKDDLCLL